MVTADRLTDLDYPSYTTGAAADALEVSQAFLRSLDAAGVVIPHRSVGGHRRYTGRQLALARRIRQLLDAGHNLAAAARIVSLEDDLATERALTARFNRQLDQAHDPDQSPVDRDDRGQQDVQ